MCSLTSNAANALHDSVNHFLSNGVVATGIVVGRILLSADQQFGVEELTVRAGSDLVNGRGVKIHKDGSRNVLAIAGLGEESLERAWVADILGVGVRAAIRAKAVFEEVAISTIVRNIVSSLSGGYRWYVATRIATYSSQAELPSWTPAWPR